MARSKLQRRPFTLVITTFILTIGFALTPTISYAVLDDCTAHVRPVIVPSNSGREYIFRVENTGSVDIEWVKISRPSSNFTILGSSASGWDNTHNDSEITFNNGQIGPASSYNFYVGVQSGNDASAENWVVEAADDSGGSGAITCNGSQSTEVSGSADTTPPVISDIEVTDITTSSVVISWVTDEPTSTQVSYGETDSYGSVTDLDWDLVTDHQVTLSGLQPNTGYHFQTTSSDESVNTAQSADNTFLTAAISTGGGGNNNGSSGGSGQTPGSSIDDDQAPAITFTSDASGIFEKAPTLTGTATDNLGLSKIEYSTDGGLNWLPAVVPDGLGGKALDFNFLPLLLEDGSYKIIARATDFVGNTTSTDAIVIVIDRLPPQVGGGVLAIGPQLLYPGKNGVIRALVGVDEKISLSTIGGAITVTLYATETESNLSHIFSMTQNPESGLWSGVLSFQTAGTYTIEAYSEDGAGNKTTRSLGSLTVLPAAKVVSAAGHKPVVGARATLYYQEPDTKEWVTWDAKAYNQTNPQIIDESGTLNLLVPPGIYYLNVSARGYKPLISEILTISNSTPITAELELVPSLGLSLGSIDLRLPSWQTSHVNLIDDSMAENETVTKLVDKPFPSFELVSTDGSSLKAGQLHGRPSVITMLNSWAPTAPEQVQALAQLQPNQDINVVPLFTQERSEKIAVFLKITGSTLVGTSDPDGTLIEKLDYSTVTVPTHYFVDRKGIIKKVMFGVLSKAEIMNQLGGL